MVQLKKHEFIGVIVWKNFHHWSTPENLNILADAKHKNVGMMKNNCNDNK